MDEEVTYIVCVTCEKIRAKITGITQGHLVANILVKNGWRRVVGGWRCKKCIKAEEGND